MCKSIMRKNKRLLVLLILLFTLTACNDEIKPTINDDINNVQNIMIEELNTELELLRNSNQELINKNIELSSELEAIKEEKEANESKISKQDLESEEDEEESKDIVETMNVKDLLLDGEPLWNYEDYSALKVDKQLYIPVQLLEEYYNVIDNDEFGHVDDIVIKGRPIENKVFKVEEVINFNELGEVLGQKQFDEAQNMEETTVFNRDGIIFNVDARFVAYTITSSKYMTEKGITIGSSKEEVRQAYGDIGEMNEDEWFTCKTSADVRRIYFTFEGGKVSSISFRIR
ncbi:hypothetical protein [Vallitalea okinawensis]|uniref:hypothetical protein n=1 Tax=Vallitalea okinawensis TaxID=2078660 RepID=UPI000CFBAB60|nr:hypothetical protein [Vallitalea okinawensis]